MSTSTLIKRGSCWLSSTSRAASILRVCSLVSTTGFPSTLNTDTTVTFSCVPTPSRTLATGASTDASGSAHSETAPGLAPELTGFWLVVCVEAVAATGVPIAAAMSTAVMELLVSNHPLFGLFIFIKIMVRLFFRK